MRTFNCQSCGIEATTRRANTKRCPLCRTLRDLVFMANSNSRPKKCEACDTPYLPVRVGEKFCGSCSEFAYANGSTAQGTCAFCEQERALPIDDVAICHHCLRDPEQRQPIIRALTRKVQRRVSAQATT